ncbi:hypothetical protein [Bradyrhizobium liaoningense]
MAEIAERVRLPGPKQPSLNDHPQETKQQIDRPVGHVDDLRPHA